MRGPLRSTRRIRLGRAESSSVANSRPLRDGSGHETMWSRAASSSETYAPSFHSVPFPHGNTQSVIAAIGCVHLSILASMDGSSFFRLKADSYQLSVLGLFESVRSCLTRACV